MDSTPAAAAAISAQEILAILPHRYPILLVDRVREIAPDRIVAIKNVSWNEPFFQGHFPGMPIMPGVLILEALAQAAGLLVSTSVENSARLLPYLVGVDRVKFRRPVVPGDRLTLEVVPLRKGGAIWKMRGEAKVNGQVVTEAEFLASIQKRDGVPA